MPKKNDKKTELQKKRESALAEIPSLKLTEETVLRYLNQYASKQEIALFLNQCAMWGLNPFLREIYLIKYSSSDPATFVVGFEAFLKRAEKIGKLSGWGVTVEGTIKTKDFQATVTIHRKDWKHPFVHSVSWDEYAQKKKDGTFTRFWDQKPRTMLKKVAISQGFRMCFPEDLGGMPYVSEEMPVDTSQLPKDEVVITVVPEEEKEVKEEKPKKETKPKEKTEKKEKPKEEEKPPEPELDVPQHKTQPPEPEPEESPDVPPEPEEEAPEPEAPPEEEKKDEKDPGDPITDQTKRFITNALTALEKDFGRDPAEIGNKICDRFERLYEIKIEKFPDGLTEFQGRKTLEWLEVTRQIEEEKRA